MQPDGFLFEENWTTRSPDTGELWRRFNRRASPFSALRHLISVANLISNKYEIFDADGDHDGDIEGKFSLRDAYTVSIDDATNTRKRR